jgi:phospholipid/cholesterol/gamma-HCH transport system ATP-binding protein
MANPAAQTAIQVRGIVNRFGTQLVHDGVDLDVAQGEILGVVGGSGTGKSVLMRSIIGLQQPEAGEVRIFGEDARTDNESEAKELRRNWGVLFQSGALFSSLTVAENIQVPLREYYKMDDALLNEIAAYKLALVGLPANAGAKYPSELSGGMRKRAGLARALALDPRILFLDEPTAGLDPVGAAGFDDLTRSLRDALGLTVFLITHDLDTLYAICDRIAVLAQQKMLVVAPMETVLDFPDPWVQEYFRGPRGRAASDTAGRIRAARLRSEGA